MELGVAGLTGSAILILLFAIYLARGIARPVTEAAAGAGQVAAGDLSIRLSQKGPGEVGELTKSFNEMAERLESTRDELEDQNAQLRESERLKSDLVNTVSHELRTPLSGVLGFTKLLLTREFDPETGATTSASSTRRPAGSRTCSTTSLTSAGSRRAASNAPRSSWTWRPSYARKPSSTASRARSTSRRRDRPCAARSDREPGPAPAGDRKPHLERDQVLAAGRRRRGQRRPGNGSVRVEVRDEGMGIPLSQQPQIFTKFFRGDAPASGITGTGLGLAVSRDIVESHGGRIGFTSAEGEGTTFFVELPGVNGVKDRQGHDDDES